MVLTKVLAYIFPPKPNLENKFHRDSLIFQIFALGQCSHPYYFSLWASLFPPWVPAKELFPILPPAALLDFCLPWTCPRLGFVAALDCTNLGPVTTMDSSSE